MVPPRRRRRLQRSRLRRCKAGDPKRPPRSHAKGTGCLTMRAAKNSMRYAQTRGMASSAGKPEHRRATPMPVGVRRAGLLGFLAAWLMAGASHHCSTAEEHKFMASPGPGDWLAARLALQACPGAAALFAHERCRKGRIAAAGFRRAQRFSHPTVMQRGMPATAAPKKSPPHVYACP